MSGRWRTGLGPRVHRLLLHLLPEAFRRKHGPAMEEAFGAAWAEARSAGAQSALRLLAREAWDLARTGVSLRRGAAKSDGVRWGDNGAASIRDRTRLAGTLADDFALALRATVRHRGFFALAVLTLALGVGSTTAMYSALRSVVLDPLPFAGSERLVSLMIAMDEAGRTARGLEPEHHEALQSEVGVFDAIERYFAGTVTLTGAGEPARVGVMRITPTMPRLMGVTPQLGRAFAAEDVAGDGARVAMLDHSFWRSRFGGRADVLGESIELNGETFIIVGVMPRRAVRPDGSPQPVEVWLPLAESNPFAFTLARLEEGVSVEAATERLDAIVRPGGEGQARALVEPVLKSGPLHDHLRVLMLAVVLMLLVACVNVSNLLLQRAAGRSHETAVRAALGAGRARLFRQFVFESVILAAASAVVGAVLAHAGLRALQALRPEQLDALRNVTIDGGVLLFCLALSAAAALLFGIVPAARGSRTNATAALGQAGRSVVGGSARIRWTLVGAQVALSFALLIGASLMLSTLREMESRDPGFRADGLIAVDVRLPTWRYAVPEARHAAFESAAEAVRRLPHVTAASLASSLPPRTMIGRMGHVEVEGRARETQPTTFHAVEAEPHHLAVLGHPLIGGRYFTEEDVRTGANATILSRAAAAQLFPGEDPIGRRFRIEGPPDYTVVGVVENIRSRGLSDEGSVPLLYFPDRRVPLQQATIAVRASRVDPQLLLDLRQSVRAAEPDAVVDVATARELFSASVARERFTTTLLSVFAALALILAAVGLYGVLSYVVLGRTREIGVRIALGSDAAHIAILVLRTGLIVTLSGLVLGALLAAAGLRLLRSEIFGLAGNDPAVWAAAAALLVVVAAAAMVLPAWRAASTDPLRAINTAQGP